MVRCIDSQKLETAFAGKLFIVEDRGLEFNE